RQIPRSCCSRWVVVSGRSVFAMLIAFSLPVVREPERRHDGDGTGAEPSASKGFLRLMHDLQVPWGTVVVALGREGVELINVTLAGDELQRALVHEVRQRRQDERRLLTLELVHRVRGQRRDSLMG